MLIFSLLPCMFCAATLFLLVLTTLQLQRNRCTATLEALPILQVQFEPTLKRDLCTTIFHIGVSLMKRIGCGMHGVS
jgi:hypothetical protein